jgi:hypothetical protein
MEGPVGQRIDVLRQLASRPPAPRGPGDIRPILVREWQRCMAVGLGAAIAVVVVTVIATMVVDPSLTNAVGLAGLVAATVVFIVLTRVLSARRLVPAYRVMAEATRGLARRWEAIDGGAIPTSTAEGLARLGDRTDDRSVSLRLWSMLASWDHLPDARRLIDAWHPADPSAIAYRDRAVALVAQPRAALDRTAAEAVIARIADEQDARAAMVALAIQEALDAEVAHRDPFPPLLAIAHQMPGDWRGAMKAR